MIAEASLVILQLGVIRPHWWWINIWFKQWLGAIRHHAITWANVDPDLWHHMALLDLDMSSICISYDILTLMQHTDIQKLRRLELMSDIHILPCVGGFVYYLCIFQSNILSIIFALYINSITSLYIPMLRLRLKHGTTVYNIPEMSGSNGA